MSAAAPDFDRIAEAVSPAQLADAIGAERHGSGWRCPSPHHDDATPSFSIFRDGARTAARCHGCDLAGSPVSVASAVWGVDVQEAARRLVDRLGIASPNGNGRRSEIVATYDYQDEQGETLFQVVRKYPPKSFRQRHACPEGRNGWTWNLSARQCSCDRIQPVLYRLPEVIAARGKKGIAVVEGEKDADRLASLGMTATTNPMGAEKWRSEYSDTLEGAVCILIPDNDPAGRKHVRKVGRSLAGRAKKTRVLELPALPEKGDVSDWLDAGGTADELRALAKQAPSFEEWEREHPEPPEDEPDEPEEPESEPEPLPQDLRAEDPDPGPGDAHKGDEKPVSRGQPGVTLADFRAYLPEHKFIFVPTRELWPAASVDASLPPVQVGPEKLKASRWLDREQPVEQMTWSPGEPMLIEDRLIDGGGWIERKGVTCFNLYRPPTIEPGDPDAAGPYLEHVKRVFPDSDEHILRFLAHRVQHPQEKINHALVLIGPQGTGKDTIIAGAVPAVGPWNVEEASPDQLLGRFNGFIKSVILRVSEARDLGDVDRYRLYEHLKTYTAAPPDVLRCDEKHMREYAVPNVTGVVVTSNHTDGIYLPPDDRRHYVAATELTKEDFDPSYFSALYRWFHEEDGHRHVAAYLHSVELVEFNPKAPPPKTAAFWQVVDAGRAPEDAELADVLDKLQWPTAVTLMELAEQARGDFADWLRDRRNRRKIPHRLEAAGYAPVRNDDANDGLWKVGKKRQAVYAKRDQPIRERIKAAKLLMEHSQ